MDLEGYEKVLKPTKINLARVIVQVLYNLDELPRADRYHVVRLARKPKPELIELHQKALKAIESRASLLKGVAD